MSKKSWKTTLGGVLSDVGLLLAASPKPNIHIAGLVVAAIGTALTGAAARDNSDAVPHKIIERP